MRGADPSQSLLAAVGWLVCSRHGAGGGGGGGAHESVWMALVEPLHAALDAAVGADAPSQAQAAIRPLRAITARLLPAAAALIDAGVAGGGAAAAVAPPAQSTEAAAAAAAAVTAAAAAASLVLQMASTRWLHALQRALGAGGACVASEELEPSTAFR